MGELGALPLDPNRFDSMGNDVLLSRGRLRFVYLYVECVVEFRTHG